MSHTGFGVVKLCSYTRIDAGFMGNPNMLAFVEDSEQQWFKMPALRDGDIELRQRD